ncbi:MAG: VTT domain-containing protein [Clostridia bacterium]|nr:VTT domain-containing protein [Clostridia bacterium]
MAKKLRRKRKIFTALGFLALLVGLAFFLFSGDNRAILSELVRDNVTKEEIQESLGDLGFKGYFTIGILSMLQVILTFIPAEPIQMMAGVAFGLWKGAAICIVGVMVGNTIIYLLYKIYGDKLSEFFTTNAEFDFSIARTSSKIALIILLMYVLPAIPYGLICIFAASLNIKYPKYLFLTTLGAVPSAFLDVGLGHIAMSASWIVAICVFLVIVTLLIVMFRYKKALFKKVNEFMTKTYSTKTTVKKGSGLLIRLVSFGLRFSFDTKVKSKLKKEVKKLEKPCIVLCTHGSAYDFLYAGRLLMKEKPQFVVARLYFYNKRSARWLRRAGCFPKSMFSADIGNAKNCMRVVSMKRTLAMMPEARLSTIGRFEGIQDSTYKFIKRMNLPVYTIRADGAYLAKPKWGDKPRKGALVEAKLSPLFTAEETKSLSLDEVKARVDEALAYDDLAWLEKHPQVRYKNKTLAEGLENILCRCPHCNAQFSMLTEKRKIYCEKCGFERTLDSRYAFTEPTPFTNFAEWYDWQKAEMEKEMLADAGWKIESPVALLHASLDGRRTLREAGNGYCTLDRTGLHYSGEDNGELVEKHFPLSEIYRLLFGAGEDFEIYEGETIYYFRPDNRRSCVAWYMASELLKKLYD